MLSYPGPRAYAQAIRQRYVTLKPEEVLVAVEGATDKRVLSPILRPNVRILAASGRDMVLGAYSELASEGLDRCLYVVDCDDNLPATFKGRPNLVVTQHRDIEADALFCLRGFDRIASEYLGAAHTREEEVSLQRDELLSLAVDLSSLLTITKDVARHMGLALRSLDPITGNRTRLTFDHLPATGAWVRSQKVPTTEELAGEMGKVLGWTAADVGRVSTLAENSWASECGTHGRTECGACRLHRHSNGHDLVSVLAIDLSQRLTTPITASNLDRDIRMTTDRALVAGWRVGQRIAAWESSTGTSVLRAS